MGIAKLAIRDLRYSFKLGLAVQTPSRLTIRSSHLQPNTENHFACDEKKLKMKRLVQSEVMPRFPPVAI